MLVDTHGPISSWITTPAGVAYAPRFASEDTRSASTRPDASSASSALLVSVAPMRGRQELLDALGAPLERPLQLARAEREHDVLGIEPGLHAEAAADVADQHAHLVVRDAEHIVAQRVAQAGRRLAAHAQRDATARGVVAREQRARLDRARREPLVDEVERDHVRGVRERLGRRGNVAVADFRGDVVRRRRPHQRRARRDGGAGVDDARQRLVAHVDRFQRVARLRRASRRRPPRRLRRRSARCRRRARGAAAPPWASRRRA